MMKKSLYAVRMQFMVTPLVVALLAVAAGKIAFAQALPAAEAAPISTGFALPTTLGSLQYAVSASQSLIWGYYGNSGTASSTNITGDVAYLSNGKRHPFSMIFSGGHSFSESGQASYSFLDLGFSQVANIGRWNLVVSDDISYLPGTAAAGLAGVPGVGDLGVTPVQVGADVGQGVLTNFSNRVSNVVAGSVQREITGKTSLNASGSYSILRFVDSGTSSGNSSSAGLDSSAATGGGGISHQINPLNSFGGNYAYSDYIYSGNNFGVATPGFVSQTGSGFYSHQFTRKFTMNVAAGPQWTTVSSSGLGASFSLFADAAASYIGKSSTSSLAFTRTTNNGYGSTGGAISDSAVFSVSREFAAVWRGSATSSYTHSSNLPVTGSIPFSIDTVVEAVQVSRAIARSLSGYASYTLEHQTNPGASSVDAFSGLSQVVGFGITYSPSALHLGRQ